jgi:flagella basal body P-ring formation protein FlgA
MTRLSVLLALVAAAWVLPARADDLPPQLRSGSTIVGDTITLGNLWQNLGDKAGIAIAAAPQPGERVTLDARWLAMVAAQNHLNWQPSNAFTHITVERAGQTVSPAAITAALRTALIGQGMTKGADIRVDDASDLAVTIPEDDAPIVGIQDLSYDPNSHAFTATVEVPAGSPSAVRMRISGRTYAVARVPELIQATGRGDVITARDLRWVSVREDTLNQDVATDPSQIVGMEPRYLIRAGIPLRLSDLRRPTLVRRDALVTIVLRTPYMTLTAQGKAISSGGKGDVIQVTNLQSHKLVEATIVSAGTVVVSPHAMTTLTN